LPSTYLHCVLVQQPAAVHNELPQRLQKNLNKMLLCRWKRSEMNAEGTLLKGKFCSGK